jgi:SAM-dependent methyltransferase
MSDRLEDTLRRLKQERDEADRRYNEALTALDRSTDGRVDVPSPPPAFDAHQLAALNDAWKIVDGPPSGSGLRHRFATFVWHIVAPYFQRQLTFNSWLVDHLNRNLAAARAAHDADERMAALLRERFAAFAEFQSRLIAYLQQITAYIDTRDRDAAGGALVLNKAISGLAENLDKRAESMAAREQRLDGRVDDLSAEVTAAHEDLRTMIAVSHQASVTLKREVERLLASDGVRSDTVAAQSPAGASTSTFGSALDAYKYVGFEDRFRGSRELITKRLESYIPFFAGASDVLDVGCGRGEFLELLAKAGVIARGIDLNHEMVEVCRGRQLEVVEADAVSYLSSSSAGSLGGLFAAQVVEHFPPSYLLRFLELAFHTLRPGARLVLETLNPACWIAFFDSYIRDITHAWPLHPETLKYFVLATGFQSAEIEFRSPVPPQDRLQRVAVPNDADASLRDVVDTFNQNVEKLNARIFTHLDYAVVGTR